MRTLSAFVLCCIHASLTRSTVGSTPPGCPTPTFIASTCGRHPVPPEPTCPDQEALARTPAPEDIMSHPQPPGEGQGYPPSLDDNPPPRSPPASRLGASPSPTDRTTPRPAETVQHSSPLANPTSPAVDPASPSRSPNSRATPGAATRDAPQRNLDNGPPDASSELVPFPSLAASKPSDPVSTQVANHLPPESTDEAKDFLDDWQQQLRASRQAIQAAQEASAQRQR